MPHHDPPLGRRVDPAHARLELRGPLTSSCAHLATGLRVAVVAEPVCREAVTACHPSGAAVPSDRRSVDAAPHVPRRR